MPRPISWLPRLHEIRRSVINSVRSHYDRNDLERLFEVQPLERVLRPRPALTAPNQDWSIDFASDVTAGGRRLRVLSVIDSFTKQSLALEVDSSFPSRRVMRVLSKAIESYGKPHAIRCDNGAEISSRHFLACAIEGKRTLSPGCDDSKTPVKAVDLPKSAALT